jgi:hypothetical protein
MDCDAIQAEADANNRKLAELGGEQGAKVAQNVAAGIAGLVIWPLWFAMDFQGAASTEATALQSRQKYLATLAGKRCGSQQQPALPPVAMVPPSIPAVHTGPNARETLAGYPPPPTANPAPANKSASPTPAEPVRSASSPEGRAVLFPVPISNSYHPSWTVNVQ